MGKAPKKMAKGAAPDLEDLIEVRFGYLSGSCLLALILCHQLDEEVPDEDVVEEDDDNGTCFVICKFVASASLIQVCLLCHRNDGHER